mmetsp:Transcript_60286/g.173976  ORF Transcript_60286/g.173976 Transcript_60286/m.173976 type:complete len:220 (-) Transcript_60286:501-1160(-)
MLGPGGLREAPEPLQGRTHMPLPREEEAAGLLPEAPAHQRPGALQHDPHRADVFENLHGRHGGDALRAAAGQRRRGSRHRWRPHAVQPLALRVAGHGGPIAIADLGCDALRCGVVHGLRRGSALQCAPRWATAELSGLRPPCEHGVREQPRGDAHSAGCEHHRQGLGPQPALRRRRPPLPLVRRGKARGLHRGGAHLALHAHRAQDLHAAREPQPAAAL